MIRALGELFVTLGFVAMIIMHDHGDEQRAKAVAAEHAATRSQLSHLQTDVSDLKQSVDALGVACEARR